MKPKELIDHYNQKYLVPTLQSLQFEYNPKQLVFQRKVNGFKQVMPYRCSRYNMTGIIVDFEVSYHIESSGLKTWYRKTLGLESSVQGFLLGMKNEFWENWNPKYMKYIGAFGYDLINKDIGDQYQVILENM